jgi:type VI secretion system secreted protein Hcp
MNIRKILAIITIVPLFGLTTSIAHAAVDMFLSFPDSDIVGESTDLNHQNEIEVLAWSWNLKVKPTKIAIKDLKITKYVDSATTSMIMKAVLRVNLGRAVLTVRKAGGEPIEYLVLTFENVTVSSFSTGGTGGDDKLVEDITLAFDGVTGVYIPQINGNPGTAIPFDWNIVTNEPL